METKKLIPMVQYILEIDWMTTTEFCSKYEVPLPNMIGGVNSFLQVDAIKHRMFLEYAKMLSKNITVDILKNNLGFTNVETRGGYPKYNNGRYIITNDEYGFWLEPYDSIDGSRLSKIEDLVFYDFSIQTKNGFI